MEKKVLPLIIFLASENSSITSGKILLILQSQVQMSPPSLTHKAKFKVRQLSNSQWLKSVRSTEISLGFFFKSLEKRVCMRFPSKREPDVVRKKLEPPWGGGKLHLSPTWHTRVPGSTNSPPKGPAPWQALILLCGTCKVKPEWDSWATADRLGRGLRVSPLPCPKAGINLFSKFMLNKYLPTPPGSTSLYEWLQHQTMESKPGKEDCGDIKG